MDLLAHKIHLADRMIAANRDVTIGEYWKLINEQEEQAMKVPKPARVLNCRLPVISPHRMKVKEQKSLTHRNLTP